MKAALVEGPGQLRVRDIPPPEPGPYEARCRLLYGSVCAGTDTHIVDGVFPWTGKLPTVLGHESIGRVVAVGDHVRTFTVGDLVTRAGTKPAADGAYSVTWGGFAEMGVVEDHEAMQADGVPIGNAWFKGVHQLLPPDTSPAAATMMITWRETLSYVTRMGFAAGKRALIIGTGGNGLAFVAHARHMGLARIACVGAPDREAVARAAGATEFANYHSEVTLPEGFDFVVDAVGKSGSLNQFLPLLAAGGTLGLYGLDDIGNCPVNIAKARGTFTFYNGGYNEAEVHARVVSLMRAGKLDARLWFDPDRPIPLARIGEAFAAIRERRAIKALVRLSDGE